uniref:tetratricopeptide repeat protein n=1 Tax=Algoriphagus sp. TaxID=1872435 RepID=UPI004047D12E
MKNKRMLSIGKCNRSPSREHTPNACSSKNSFIFSMVGAEWIQTKVLKKASNLQTRLIIRLFYAVPYFFLLVAPLVAQQPKQSTSTYLKNAWVIPDILQVHGDSVRFEVSGSLPATSGVFSKTRRLLLSLRSDEGYLDLGALELNEKNGKMSFKETVAFSFSPWMEGASLELDYVEGRDDASIETKVLAKGVKAPQFLVRLGQPRPGERTPVIGKFDFQEKQQQVRRPVSKVYYFSFEAGKSEWIPRPGNEKLIQEMALFLDQNSDLESIKVTGLQSPEMLEGRSSQLGYLRAETIGQKLLQFFPEISSNQLNIGSRWNDWFDFRLFIAADSNLSEAQKSVYFEILREQGSYFDQATQLKALPGFEEVAAQIYPKLRAVKVEVTAMPATGMTKNQKAYLQEVSLPEAKNQWTYEEWVEVVAACHRLDEKLWVLTSMWRWYQEPSVLSNLAVVRMRQSQAVDDLGSKEILWEEAARLLAEANRLKEDALTLYNHGQLLALQGFYWEAYKVLSTASVLAKSTPKLLSTIDLLRAALDIRRGDYKLALLRFGSASKGADDLFNLGLANFLVGDYASANLSFESAVLADRESGYGYYGLAMVALELGQLESMSFYLEKAMVVNPFLRAKAKIDPEFGLFFQLD